MNGSWTAPDDSPSAESPSASSSAQTTLPPLLAPTINPAPPFAETSDLLQRLQTEDSTATPPTQQPPLKAYVSPAAGTASASRKRSLSPTPTSTALQSPPSRAASPWVYTPQETALLEAELLSALQHGKSIKRGSEVVKRLRRALGRSEGAVAQRLGELKQQLADRARGRPYTAEEVAVLRTEYRCAVAQGITLTSLATQLCERFGRTRRAVHEKLLRIVREAQEGEKDGTLTEGSGGSKNSCDGADGDGGGELH